MFDKSPGRAEIARLRGYTFAADYKKDTENDDIQIRLEILRILFSSPNLKLEGNFTIQQVENYVKTGEGLAK